MPTYNLQELMSFATDNIGERADIPQSTVSRIVNEAYFEVADEWDSMEQEKIAVSSTSSGENRIELPADFAEPIAFAIVKGSGGTGASLRTSHTTLNRISVEEAMTRDPDTGGVPNEYAYYNSWVELFPSPNSVYQLHFRFKSSITDLIALDDIPSLETRRRPLILRRTEEKLMAWDHDFDAEAAARNRYLQEASTKKDLEAQRQSGEARLAVRPIYGTGGRRRRARSSRFTDVP